MVFIVLEYGFIQYKNQTNTLHNFISIYLIYISVSKISIPYIKLANLLSKPDLEIISNLLGTWVSDNNPTAKQGSEYWRKGRSISMNNLNFSEGRMKVILDWGNVTRQ